MRPKPKRIVINLEIRNTDLLKAMDAERKPLEWSRADVVRAALRMRYGLSVTLEPKHPRP